MPALFLVGPTACGKSKTAVNLAKKLSGEVVNMDSMQVYNTMRIGSARPTEDEMDGVPHHLFGTVPLGSDFSAAEYKTMACKTMEEVQARHHLPIFCGGTGLYLQTMTYRMEFGGISASEDLRKELQARLTALGNEGMHRELMAVDPATAERLHPNDTKRVLRALEVYYATGTPLSEQGRGFTNLEEEDYPFLIFGLRMERSLLYERINTRVDAMLSEGLLAECETILSMGIPLDHPSLMGIGYRQVFPYLKGEYSYDEMVERIKRETRRYAKRQMTWFNRDARIHWVDADGFSTADDLVNRILSIMKEKSDLWRDLCDQ